MENLLVNKVAAVKEVRQAAEYQKKKQACILTGLAGSSKPVFFAAADKLLGGKGSMAFITASREEIRTYRRELNYLYPDLPMQELYPVSLPRVQADTQSLELQAGRAAALRFLSGEERGIVFITAEALQQKQLRPSGMSGKALQLAVGEEHEQRNIAAALLDLGYERTEQVDALGQFCLRGDILDVYPINSSTAVRIEWFDNELDAMRSFDVDTQRSLQTLTSIKIAPLKVDESFSYDADIFEYCAADTMVVVDEPVHVFSMLEKLDKENKEHASELFGKQELIEQLAANGAVLVSALGHSYLQQLPSLNIPVRAVAPYNKNTNLLVEDLQNWLAEGITPLIMLSGSIKARGFADNLRNYGLKGHFSQKSFEPGVVNVTYGDLDHGFRFWDEEWLLLTENDIFGMQKRKRLHTKNQGQQLQYFSDIKAGDYVVHKVHGIGRYIGVENVEVDGIHRDYLLLAYAGDDKLYVPVEQVGMLHKYVGSEGSVPRLSKMGGNDWKRTTAKAAKAITELAEELLRLYAQRQIMPGHAFSPDCQLQKDFEAAFPYEETPDQLKAIAEIKADMEKPQPMERLLCGDVGYGKTEVALRAAFKAVLDGKQVAVLAPTTVLAQQHYITFKERVRNFGVEVRLLNRFCTPKEQRTVLQEVADGKVDILIGTHRLLQPDVNFTSLGLLIIDEEQRFGVAQKEKIKKWHLGIDVLSLSATPIPRTLHMALVNGRDMSVIEEAPTNRQPVQTYVLEHDDAVINEAIRRELRRGGQVFYLHNNVETISSCAAKIQEAVPEAKIAIGHGKMKEGELSEVWRQMLEQEIDVLVCTTIIETGVDLPNANTLIIENADCMGLSQLHQLRGRVGRSSRRAYAYFTFRRNKVLTEIQQKRLAAIREFTEFGSGFRIAMRDLELRGAGNIMGAQQHGHMESVGYDMYLKLLDEAVSEEKGEQNVTKDLDCLIDISVDAHIPESYVESLTLRLDVYRRIADIRSNEDADDVIDELQDRFGKIPNSVLGLIDIALVRNKAYSMGIYEIRQNGTTLMLFVNELKSPQVADLLIALGGKAKLVAGAKPCVAVECKNSSAPLEILTKIFGV